MKSERLFWILLVIALGIGAFIGWIDTSPNWDDTGITVALVLGVTALFGFANPNRAWVWALAVGFWIPLLNILSSGNFGSAFALLVAFVGAYVGAIFRRLLFGLA